MQKDTSKIIEELNLCDSFKSFYDENSEFMVSKSLSDMLSELLEKKELKKVDVIKRSEMSEVYTYQIFSGLRVPERKKLLALALGMSLDLNETQQLLKTAGYSQLYVKIPFDSFIIYGLCKNKSVVEVNELLYEYGLETLG